MPNVQASLTLTRYGHSAIAH
jgi:hypothetical protein